MGINILNMRPLRLGSSIIRSLKSRQYSTSSGINLSGIFPPLATPFNSDESIAWEKLEDNLEKLNKEPLSGYLVHGSNGEYKFMSTQEKLDMVKMVKQQCSDKLILAGSGCESTMDTIKMTEEMVKAGADAVVVVTPCYYKGGMTGKALEAHYKAVADASPVPVILYTVPALTMLDLPLETIVNLASHPNIIGIKESGGDITKIGSMIHQTSDCQFQVLAGSASFLLASLTLGAVGSICAVANVLPGPCCQLMKLYQEGKLEEAKLLQHKLISPNNAVTRQFGVPGLKMTMDMLGYQGGHTRRPLLPLTPEQSQLLRQAFVSSGFQM